MSGFNKFLESGVGASNLSDGSQVILASTLSAVNLDASRALQTDSSKIIQTASFDLAPGTGLLGQFMESQGDGTTQWVTASGAGNVIGPVSSTDTAITRFSGITGTVIQNSGVLLDGSNNMSNISVLSLTEQGVGSDTVSFNLPSGSATQAYDLPAGLPAVNGEVLSATTGGVMSWVSNEVSESSTGVINGGLMSVNVDDTKFDITDGNGRIHDPDTNVTIEVVWSGLTAQSTAYSGDVTYVSINSSSVVVFSATQLTNSEIRDTIFLGLLVHLNAVNINTAFNNQMTLNNPTNAIRDLAEAIGLLNISGNIMGSNSLLTVFRSSGNIFKFGGNYMVDKKNPNVIPTALLDTNDGLPSSFTYHYQDASVLLGLVDIDTLVYDDGNGAGSPGTMPNNQWQVQRIFVTFNGAIVIMPGQFTYGNKADAISAVDSEGFTVSVDLSQNGVLISLLAVKKSIADLSTIADAEFFVVGKFGGQTSSGSGGDVFGPAGSTLDAIARYASTSGKLLADSVATVSTAGEISTPLSIKINTIDVQNNTRYGFGALDGVTTGLRNTAFGDNALTALTTGDDSIAVGYQALDSVIDVDELTAVGSGALAGAITGTGNLTAVGFNALNSNTSGHNNTAIGHQASQSTTTSNRCTVIGAGADSSRISGTNSIVIGYLAGSAWTSTEDRNICIGNLGIAGDNNTCRIGDSDQTALYIAGTNRIAIGTNALDNVSGGASQNIAVGNNSLLALENAGDENVSIGHDCGIAITTGDSNILLGHSAGGAFTTGNNNIGLGSFSGSSWTVADSDNICIGNAGVAGDVNKLRLGSIQTNTFIAGIHNVTPSGATEAVIVDSSGELGSSDIFTLGLGSVTNERFAIFDGTGGKQLKSTTNMRINSSDAIFGVDTLGLDGNSFSWQLKASTSLSSNQVMFFPPNIGNSGNYFRTDGTNASEWSAFPATFRSIKQFSAAEFIDSSDAEYPVTVVAALINDTDSGSTKVRSFLNAANSGVGFSLIVPTRSPTYTDLTFELIYRKVTAGSGTVRFDIYAKGHAIGIAITANPWDTSETILNADAGNNLFMQRVTTNVNMVSMNFLPGTPVDFQLVRNVADTYTGSVYVFHLDIRMQTT